MKSRHCGFVRSTEHRINEYLGFFVQDDQKVNFFLDKKRNKIFMGKDYLYRDLVNQFDVMFHTHYFKVIK